MRSRNRALLRIENTDAQNLYLVRLLRVNSQKSSAAATQARPQRLCEADYRLHSMTAVGNTRCLSALDMAERLDDLMEVRWGERVEKLRVARAN